MSTTTLVEIVDENVWIPWCYTSPKIYAIMFFILLVIFAVFNFIFGVYCIYKIHHETIKYFIGLKILYFMINILFALSGIAYICHLIIGFECLDGYILWISVGNIGADSYMYGISLLYLLYLFRLYMLCNGSVLKLSIYTLIFCGIGFIIQFTIPPFVFYYFVEGFHSWDDALMCVNIFTFVNAAFSILLLYLFWAKVKQLGKSQGMRENVVLSPAIRYAFCAFVTIISGEMVNSISIYRSYIKDTEFLWSMHLTAVVIDECVNLICVFLQFQFGKVYYDKYLHKMHSFVEHKLARKMSSTEIRSTRSTSTQTINSTTNATSNAVSNTKTDVQTEKTETNTVIQNVDMCDMSHTQKANDVIPTDLVSNVP
eukprot:360790_1